MNRPDRIVIRKAAETAQEIEWSANQIRVPLTRKLGLIALLRESFKDAGTHHLGAFAGNLAFNCLLAIFPFFLLLLSGLAVFHRTRVVNAMLGNIKTTLPVPAFRLMHDQVVPSTQSHMIGGFTLGAAASIIFVLWSLSWGFSAIMEAVNVMYEVEETRPIWLRYLISIVMSVAAVTLLAGAFVLLVFGLGTTGGFAHVFGLETVLWVVWTLARWLLLIFLISLAFALIYWAAPNTKQRFTLITPGVIVAVALWLVFSLLSSQYVNHVGSYNSIYGTFAGVIVLLLYMYCSSFILLFGAEINQVIRKHAPEREKQEATAGSRVAPNIQCASG